MRYLPTRQLALLFALALPGLAAAANYTVQPGSSTLGFTGDFQGSEFEGNFGKWTALIRYDAADLGQSKFDVTVDMTSASTGDSDRDQALPGADFFNAMAYPTAHFVSTGFRRAARRARRPCQHRLSPAWRPAGDRRRHAVAARSEQTAQPGGHLHPAGHRRHARRQRHAEPARLRRRRR